MPRWQRAYIVATCAIIGFAFAYAACDWGQWTKLVYLPVPGAFTLAPPSASVTIGYWGILAWGAGGGACGAILGVILVRITSRPWPDRVLRLFGAWAITAILLAGSYYTWSLWPW